MSPTRGSNFWGPREGICQIVDSRKSLFFDKRFHGGREIRTHYQQLKSFRRRVKALVCWATGKRVTNRLPKLSLIILSPPSEQRGSWSPYGAVRAYSSPKFFTISEDPGRVIYQILHVEIHFSLNSASMVDARFELTASSSSPFDDAICERISPLGYW